MWKEFKDFAVKGSALDLAIGVIIGAAFGKIVTSLVNDIIMPPLGVLLGRVDFSNFYINLSRVAYPSLKAAKDAGAPTINYGMFINEIVNFFIVAFAVFFLVRQINRFRRKSLPVAPSEKECPFCLSHIPLKAVKCAHCTSKLD